VTHSDLVARAALWLQRKHAVVITEMAHGAGEEADAIGFTGYGDSTLVECKVSRSDFAADAKKLYRQFPKLGMGKRRYFMVPKGLINVDSIPTGWGLLEVDGTRVRAARHGMAFPEYAWAWEIQLLVSSLRRPDGIAVKRYTYETKCRATIGVLADAQIAELTRQRDELRRMLDANIAAEG